MEMEDSRIAKSIRKASKLYSESSGISNWPHRVKALLSKCYLLQWWREDTFIEDNYE